MPGLLDPLCVRHRTLRNRIVMPPLWSGKAGPDGLATDAHVAYHQVRAAAGCGLVIVEHAFVDGRGRHTPTQLSLASDAAVPGLARVAAAVRDEGALACVQLAHAGSKGDPAVLGRAPVGPSAVAHPYARELGVPEALSQDEIADVVEAFAAAARRARDAGFDAVEVHAAHGFLLSQFLSPLTNWRVDAYGGPLENRGRLHLEVLCAVREAVGPDLLVFLRLGGADDTPGGLSLDDTCALAPRLVAAGLDVLDVSGGLQGSRPEGLSAPYFLRFSGPLRRAAGVPVIVTGGITEPRQADTLVREGGADLVGVGRAMLAEPDWAARALRELAA
jgi:2,4-dienoyl-CoA reductase-like NADH-dependent reductase (Old Yellow Enzyme family)